MFERLFGGPKTPENKERLIQEAVEKKISELGINSPGLYMAFLTARNINQENKLGLTNNRLLNIVKDAAQALSSPIEDSMYGGIEKTMENIDMEIDKLRKELTDEERRS